jgi:hyperosmotically inducible protein
MNIALPLATLVLLAATGSACSLQGATRGAPVDAAPTMQTDEAARDAAITAAIKTQLSLDNDLSALRIDVDTQRGHVTLGGAAPNTLARERATRIAASVAGVRGVENRLLVPAGS